MDAPFEQPPNCKTIQIMSQTIKDPKIEDVVKTENVKTEVKKGTKRSVTDEAKKGNKKLKTGDETQKDAGSEDASPEEEPETVSVLDLIDEIIKNKQEQAYFQKTEIENLRNVKKAMKKELRTFSKTKGKKGLNKGVKRPPKGIATQKYISPDLCAFLGEPEGTRLPRTVVTKRVSAYVKEKHLTGREGFLKKDKTLNHQYITPDAALIKLIGNPDALTFFTMQTRLNPHFIEPTAA